MPTDTNIIQIPEAMQSIDTTLPGDVADQTTRGSEATCACEAAEEATTNLFINPAIIISVTGATITKFTKDIDSPLPGNDTREEASNIDIVDSAPMILQDLDSINPEIEAHVYTYALPVMDILEVNLSTVDDLDDSAASASSSHYNDFERFLDDDRMMWIPRPAKRMFGKKAVVGQYANAARPTHVRGGADGKHVPSHVTQSDDSTVQRTRKVSTE